MKVLVLSHMYPSTSNEVLGIFVHDQTKALIRKGVEVKVVSPVPWTPFPLPYLRSKWRGYSQVPLQSEWEGVDAYHPRYLTFPKAWFFASSGQRMYYGIRRLVEGLYRTFPFDLIHAHVALPDGYAAAILTRRFRKPVVITIHGQDLQHTIAKSAACAKAVEYAIVSSSRVILVSNKLRRIAGERLDHTDKLTVIPNGVDPQKLYRGESTLTRRYKETRVILSVSNLVETKGLDINLKALERLAGKYKDLRYVVIGEGSEKKRLIQISLDSGVRPYVEFAGQQPHDKVMEYMAGCHLFSLPSWSEGFGIVYLEAMANGKPVIGCQGEGIVDFVEHGKTGLLVKPKDVDSLVEALDYLLSHPGEAKAMGDRARRLVLEDYTWEKNAEKTIAVYEEVLNRGAASTS